MNLYSISNKILNLKRKDLQLRDELIKEGKLFDGYNKEMEELHRANARELNDIVAEIGYPTIDKVGKQASDAAWLVIQHSIGQPDFMKRCRDLLEIAVSEKKADPKNLAYLTDRIAVYEGKPQLYGTQFDWDETGKLNPYPLDDLTKLNQRRRSVGLNTLAEQTEIIRKQAEMENQFPPTNFEKRKQQFVEWRRSVCWIK